MNTARIEKVYGERTLAEDSQGYIRMSIPPDALDEPRLGLEPGARVKVKGLIEGDETYLRLDAVE